MKKYLTILILAFVAVTSFSGCKKAIEKKIEEQAIMLMTDGSWLITQFTEGGSDITSQFNGWEFTFKTDFTMTGAKGATTVNGTWSYNYASKTITTYSASPVSPLEKLNGSWLNTISHQNDGTFTRTAGTVSYLMQITKK